MPAEVVIAYTTVPDLPKAYRLSNSFVGSISGSVGELARGAEQKKVASPAHSFPAICLAFSMCPNTADESGLAGAGLGACARTHPAKIIASVTAVEGYVWGRIVSVPTSDHKILSPGIRRRQCQS